MNFNYSCTLFFISILYFNVFGQNSNIKPAILDEKFPDFTLPSYQGDTISIYNYKGKNLLLIVSRGKYADDKWCTICHYQYAEWADIVLNENIKEEFNLEIVFLLPYSQDTIKNWVKAFPYEMKKIEKWKYPKNEENISQGKKEWMEFCRKHYPRSFDFKDKNIELTIPVLVDEDQMVSKGLDLFRMEWDGGSTAQNIPAVYLIDNDGNLQFKYISQNTTDRPTAVYLKDIIRKMVVR